MVLRRVSFALLVSVALPAAASAAVLTPVSIGTSVPSGTNNPVSGAFTDDVLLDSLDFGNGVVFSSGASFRAITAFEVTSGRGNINAEFGDADNADDGNDNPFVKAGVSDSNIESTDPAIQDAALLNAFNSRSLTEMNDGESGPFSFKVLFENSLTDNDANSDDTPELVFVERGMNDSFNVELILGGTFANPILSDPLLIDSGDFWASGLSVDTTEIGGGQELGIGGFDLNDWNLGAGAVVYGFLLTRVTGGPDLNGFFLSAVNPGDFGDPLSPVPLPGGLPLFLTALGGLAFLRARRRPA